MKKRALLILAVGAVAFIFMSLSSGALQRQPTELIIHAYENFKLTPELQHRFKRENHITLKIVNFDSAEQMLDQAIGFAFLAATVAAFPEDSAYPWEKFWRDYTSRILHFTETWNEASGLQFSANNNNPESHPMVVSFAAAPVAEMLYKHVPRLRIGNLEDIAFEQPRFVGIRKDTRLRAVTQKFVDSVVKKLVPESR